jgi:hypothetical protein
MMKGTMTGTKGLSSAAPERIASEARGSKGSGPPLGGEGVLSREVAMGWPEG